MTIKVLSAVMMFIAVQTVVCHDASLHSDRFIAGVNTVPMPSMNGPARRRPAVHLRPPLRDPSPAEPSHDISNTIGTHISGIYNTVRGQGHSRRAPETGPIIPDRVLVGVRRLPNPGSGAATEDRDSTSASPGEPAHDVGEPDVGAGIVPEGDDSNRASSEGSTQPENTVDIHGDNGEYHHNGHGHHGHDHDTSYGGGASDGHVVDGDHDHIHEHLDKVPSTMPLHHDLGGNIMPLDDTEMTLDHHWHKHEGSSSIDGTLSRTDKSLGSEVMDLCDLCLCDNDHTRIYCKVDHPGTQNLTLEAKLIPATTMTLKLKNFDQVTVLGDTFASDASLLQHLIFEDIRTLQLQEHSLHFSPHSRENMVVNVEMLNVGVPVLPSNALTQLDTNTRQGRAHYELALEKTRWITLRLYQCHIREIESHALYRARLLYFNLTDVTIGSMATKSFDLDVYEEWVVQDSSLPHLPTSAVCLHAEKSVVFSRNLIKELDPNAWAIEAGGQVLFEFNTVSKIRGRAFLNIKPMKGSRSANIVFLNNTVISADEDALVTNDHYPRHERKVENNRFNLVCECNISIHFKEMMDIHENDSFDLLTHDVVLRNSLCVPHLGSSHYKYIDKFLDQECEPVPVMVIAITAAVVVLLVASVTVAVVCARRAKKALEEVSYLGETSSRSFSTINTHAGPQSPSGCDHLGKNVFYDSQGNPQWIMAVPEVKTYQETEVHVTYEESQPIQSSARNSCQDYMIEMQRKTQIRQSCPFN